jgi:ArsR family transcriptional regulator, lead/cadmium/zinc/bismuth-responsive transcriptional repressor
MNEDQCKCRMIHEDQVEAARKTALADDEIDLLSQTFKALGDPSRLRILTALEKREMCVCDLAALLTISESAVSHQLRLLRTIKLVKNRREGAVLYYSLDDTHVNDLIEIALEHIRE